MRAWTIVLLVCGCSAIAANGQDTALKARELERQGDSAVARSVLQREAASHPKIAEAQFAYAEFLDRHHDPEARTYYQKALEVTGANENRSRLTRSTRRLMELDLLAGDAARAKKELNDYQAKGGTDIVSTGFAQPTPVETIKPVLIPGPLRSFARMAALSPDLDGDEILSALARNVVTNGYQASQGSEGLEPTEYMKLLLRYVSQAAELGKLASDSTIKIETCDSPHTADLLRIIGYRMRGACGSDVVLETVNATRAFLTIDSGFPLAELEQALRTNRPFVYDYKPTAVSVLYGTDFWLSASSKEKGGDFITTFLNDPSLCRLYLGLSKLDAETAEAMKKGISVPRLKAFAHVLDFYGGMFQIHNGEAIVPGGPQAVATWREMTGKNPHDGAAFFERIMTRDDGWLASTYDALARIDGPSRNYLLNPKRLERFYLALKGKITSPGPARPVFRSNSDMLLLTQRLRIESDGRPHVPGSLEVWKNLFVHHPHGKYDGKLTKLASSWKEPDDLIEALFALCRKPVENEPLKIYMSISDMERYRTTPLDPATVDRLARDFKTFGSQYAIFSEAPELTGKTIVDFLDTAAAISEIRDQSLRSDTAGMLQGLTGIWQIFCRQGSIAPSESNAALSSILEEFGKSKNSRELFDSGRKGVKILLAATHTPAGVPPQDRIIDLLSGEAAPSDADSHRQVVQGMIQIFEAQRLVSLKTIFDLADHLDSLTRGEKLSTALAARLASKIGEIQLPRSSLSAVEKNAMSFGYWTERHVESERKFNIRAALEKAGNDAVKVSEIRGQLTPFLRDTLVGLNYVHYAPPGAQILLTNPLFVRSHDFIGLQSNNDTWHSTEVVGSGWPSSAGGRLRGSLASLPYALAEAEQNFLVPSREQALIWGDLVPQMILSAKVPRWWHVTPAQLHWVGLHMSQGEALMADAAFDPERRKAFAALLARHAPPVRVQHVMDLLTQGNVTKAVEQVTPTELFAISSEWLRSNREDQGLFAAEARQLESESPQDISDAAVSRAFGTPKPLLTHSYRPELLNLRTMPTLMGYSSRIMAESWESNTLYYAALADELQMRPSQLNVVVPEWTQATVEKIFATHLEDWPALLRSLRVVGDDVRQRAHQQMAADQKASLQ